jgi:hypothetical protein
MNQLLEAYPKGMLEAFGITDLADVENYMNSQVFCWPRWRSLSSRSWRRPGP